METIWREIQALEKLAALVTAGSRVGSLFISPYALRKGEKVLLLPLVQHPIDHHTGYGDIEPQGQRPARNLAMLVEPLFERTRQSNQRQRENDGREDNVRQQIV